MLPSEPTIGAGVCSDQAGRSRLPLDGALEAPPGPWERPGASVISHRQDDCQRPGAPKRLGLGAVPEKRRASHAEGVE